MQASISELAKLTRFDRRTVTKRIEGLTPDVAGTYATHEALPLVYGLDSGKLDAVQERAKLDRVRAELVELQRQERAREIIPAPLVLEHWSAMVGNARAKLLNLPGRLATVAVGASTVQEIERNARDLINEALTELSGNGVPNSR